MFSKEQKEILKRSKIKLRLLTEKKVFSIADRRVDVGSLSDTELVEFLEITNALYRGGEQIINDSDYDLIFLAGLRRRHPRHPFLHSVEPEAAVVGKTVELPVRMLSTDKANNRAKIDLWIDRLKKAAKEIGINHEKLLIHVTPKLDGFAAYDDGERFYTRGDGRRGTDITRVFEHGLKVGGDGKRGHGAGEIVVDTEYFEKNLSDYFDNTRNFQAAIIAEKKIDVRVQDAIDAGAALFFPFSQLPSWEGRLQEMIDDFDNIVAKVWAYVDFDVDGVILEVTDETLKEYMGATQHHHRWQIAFKANIERANVKVLQVTPQTSRTGRINPVVELEPTRLSGATIRRASAHHYKMVKKNGIGAGTVIELVRSGMVIPKIEKVVIPSKPTIPKTCPSCHAKLVWDGDYLYCPNTAQCPAQIEHKIEHFFKTLGNIDGFGSKTIQKLYSKDIRSVYEIYMLTVDKFTEMNFGEKTSQNLVDQLLRSRTELVPDWRFLAAFGVFRMGAGNCERLLQYHPLLRVFHLDDKEISKIEGFANETATAIVEGVRKVHNEFLQLYGMGFNIERTPLLAELKEAGVISQISGKKIVFTGSMEYGTRPEMEMEARKLGAKVGNTVSKNSDYLVTGQNVGSTKINAAKSKGVKVISETEYLSLIKKHI